jgi:S1-C subfamily serine protease
MIRALWQFASIVVAFVVLPIAAADEATDKRIANCIMRGGTPEECAAAAGAPHAMPAPARPLSPAPARGGIGFMLPLSLKVKSVTELNGAVLCVLQTQEQKVADFMREHRLRFEAVAFPDGEQARAAYEAERCNALVADVPALESARRKLRAPSDHVILPETIAAGQPAPAAAPRTAAAPRPAPPAPLAPPVSAAPASNDCATAEADWKNAEQQDTLAAYEHHLASFANCRFATRARLKIDMLRASGAEKFGPNLDIAEVRGLQVAAMSDVQRLRFGIARKLNGVVVIGVDANTAASVDFEPGDVIAATVIDGDTANASAPAGLRERIEQLRVGKGVKLVVFSPRGQSRHVELRAGPRPAATRVLPDKGLYVPQLGLHLANLTDELRRRLRVRKRVTGVLVTGVEPRSPAARARVLPGDVIDRIDFPDLHAVADVDEAQAALAGTARRLLAQHEEGSKHEIALLGTSAEDSPRGASLLLPDDGALRFEAAPVTIVPLAARHLDIPALGLHVDNLTDELRQRFAIPDAVRGLVIVAVDAQSEAAKEGLRPGDVIDDTSITEAADDGVGDVDDLYDRLTQNAGMKDFTVRGTKPDGSRFWLHLRMAG